MFDTHCHLNFSAFEGKVSEVIKRANEVGVTHFVVPGTDIETSKKAVEIVDKYDHVWAAVGVHPHHIYQIQNAKIKCQKYISKIKNLLTNKKVVAIGEIGLDRYVYKKTKYENYQIDEEFINLQKTFFIAQLKLAKEYRLSVIVHNRETKDELLELLNEHWDDHFRRRMVFHCCEPDEDLLKFAKEHQIFIGVDGDITYNKKKQAFIKKIPLDFLVLETDAPFLIPEPLKSQRLFPNEPKNLLFVKKLIAQLLSQNEATIDRITSENGQRLFFPTDS